MSEISESKLQTPGESVPSYGADEGEKKISIIARGIIGLAVLAGGALVGMAAFGVSPGALTSPVSYAVGGTLLAEGLGAGVVMRSLQKQAVDHDRDEVSQEHGVAWDRVRWQKSDGTWSEYNQPRDTSRDL